MIRLLPKLVRYGAVKNIASYSIPRKRFYFHSAKFFPWNHPLSRYENIIAKQMGLVRILDKAMQEFLEQPWTKYNFPVSSRLAAKEFQIVHTFDKYELKIDMSSFLEDEINVRLINNTVEISAKHEENLEQHGPVFHEIRRQFTLPEDVDLDSVVSVLTKDGNFILKGKIKGREDVIERVLNIQKENQHTNTETTRPMDV